MIHAVHALLYVENAAAARKFFKQVLGWPSVDAGHGWLIFALPPAEIAAHPAESPADNGRCELYLMCDDVHRTVSELARKGVRVGRAVVDRGWGLVTSIRVPGGGEIGLYQPRHPTAVEKPRRGRRPAQPGPAKPASKARAPAKAPAKAKARKARA